MVKMEFWERGFRERSYSLLERARRGEEDGVLIGGQGGVGGGENSDEDLEVSGFMVEKTKVNGGIVVVCCC